MILVAEQIKYLRARKRELLEKISDYKTYIESRDKNQIDGIGLPSYGDFSTDCLYSGNIKELKEIDSILSTSEIKMERNLDQIEYGTNFDLRFSEDEEKESYILVDNGVFSVKDAMISGNSDLGKAIYGKRPGDEVTYKVVATGRTVSVTIEAINKMETNYEHFIREREYSRRISELAKKELLSLRCEDIEEYNRRFAITPSQSEILKQEIQSLEHVKTPSAIARLQYLKNVEAKRQITVPPEDDTIGIGSYVEIILEDEEGNIEERKFELINRAISTELESEYVERISPLGTTIFGLRTNDKFRVKRKHKPSIKGIIKSVDNSLDKEKVQIKTL